MASHLSNTGNEEAGQRVAEQLRAISQLQTLSETRNASRGEPTLPSTMIAEGQADLDVNSPHHQNSETNCLDLKAGGSDSEATSQDLRNLQSRGGVDTTMRQSTSAEQESTTLSLRQNENFRRHARGRHLQGEPQSPSSSRPKSQIWDAADDDAPDVQAMVCQIDSRFSKAPAQAQVEKRTGTEGNETLPHQVHNDKGATEHGAGVSSVPTRHPGTINFSKIFSPSGKQVQREANSPQQGLTPGAILKRKETFRKNEIHKYHAPMKSGIGRSLIHPLKLFAIQHGQENDHFPTDDDMNTAEDHSGVQGGWLMKGRMFTTCLRGLMIMSKLAQNRDGKEDVKYLSKQSINILVLSNLLITIFFAVFDLSTAIIFALAWPHDSYLCDVVRYDDVIEDPDDVRRSTGGFESADGLHINGLNWGIFCLLLVVPVVDSAKLILRFRTRSPDGTMVGTRYWTKPNIGDGISLESRLTETFWLIISVVSLGMSAGLCYPHRLTLVRLIHELHKLSHFLRALHSLHKCYTLRKKAKKYLQIAVSRNKRRFVSPLHSIDIDLSYICDRLIAMSIPCHASTMHRNEIKEVCRFFRIWHYGHFKIYNLCEAHEENGSGNYDTNLFYNQVQKVPMKDKHAPPLSMLVHFCEDASAWLDEDPLNVLAVHCKGGTGRTGILCASLMVFTKRFRTAQGALSAFQKRRMCVPQQLAVRSPSQKRYVSYVEAMVNKGVDFLGGTPKLISSVSLENVPDWMLEGQSVNFQVEAKGQVVFDYAKQSGVVDSRRMEGRTWGFEFDNVAVHGDVTVRIFVTVNGSIRKDIKPLGRAQVLTDNTTMVELCRVQLHTAFMSLTEDSVFEREEIDGIHDLSYVQIPQDFRLVLRITEVNHDTDEMYREMMTRYSATQHFIWLAAMLPGLACKVCPETTIFNEGEVMFSVETKPSRRQLFFIVSGTAKRCLAGAHSRRSIINNSEQYGECIGSGEFYGIGAFILGHGLDYRATELRAWSKRVVVRAFTIPGPVEDVVQSVIFDKTTPQESVAVWEALARQLGSRRKAEDALNLHGGKIMTLTAQQKATGQSVMQRMRAGTPGEELLHVGSGKITWASNAQQHSNHDEGLLVITSEQIIFSASENQTEAEDMQLPLESIQKAAIRSGWLSLTVNDYSPGDLGVRQRGREEATSPPVAASPIMGVLSRSASRTVGLLQRTASAARRERASLSQMAGSIIGRVFRPLSRSASEARTPSADAHAAAQTKIIGGHVLLIRPDEQSPLVWIKKQIQLRAREIKHHRRNRVLNKAYNSQGKVRPGYLGFGYYLPGEIPEPETEPASLRASTNAKHGGGGGVGLEPCEPGCDAGRPGPLVATDSMRREGAQLIAPPPPSPAPAPPARSGSLRGPPPSTPLDAGLQPAGQQPRRLSEISLSQSSVPSLRSPIAGASGVTKPAPGSPARSPKLRPRGSFAGPPKMHSPKDSPVPRTMAQSPKTSPKATPKLHSLKSSPGQKPISKLHSPIDGVGGASGSADTAPPAPSASAAFTALRAAYPLESPVSLNGPPSYIDATSSGGSEAPPTDWNAMLSNMWSASIPRYYGGGDLIIEIGNAHGCLYHILSGRVQCLDAKNNPLVTLEAGEILGEMSFLDVGTTGARANVVAIGPVECQLLSQEALRTLTHFHAHLGARIYRGITITSFLRYYSQRNSSLRVRPGSKAVGTSATESE